jgi:hypothetical protein
MRERDKDLIGILLRERNPSPLFLRTDAPVTFADFTAEERLCLMNRHRLGPPLHDLQRAVWDAIPEARKPRLSDPAVFDPAQFDPAKDPKRFLDQMVAAFTLLGRRNRDAIAETHNFHPDFEARIKTGTSKQFDAELIILQQRQALPAYQAKMLEMHGTAYVDWLKNNGLEICTQSPRMARERRVLGLVAVMTSP